jgi:undecaprenyl-diphosphatase
LISIDKKLLLFINGHHSYIFDSLMLAATDRFFWIPFYAGIVGYLIWKLRKKALILIPLIALLITAADQFASGLVKPLVGRLRPCHEPSLKDLLHLVKDCGGEMGFISSHAANSFALTAFLMLVTRFNNPLSILLISWAILISYSRIYLGVHYPADIIFGWLAGMTLGIVFYVIYKVISGKIEKRLLI